MTLIYNPVAETRRRTKRHKSSNLLLTWRAERRKSNHWRLKPGFGVCLFVYLLIKWLSVAMISIKTGKNFQTEFLWLLCKLVMTQLIVSNESWDWSNGTCGPTFLQFFSLNFTSNTRMLQPTITYDRPNLHVTGHAHTRKTTPALDRPHPHMTTCSSPLTALFTCSVFWNPAVSYPASLSTLVSFSFCFMVLKLAAFFLSLFFDPHLKYRGWLLLFRPVYTRVLVLTLTISHYRC